MTPRRSLVALVALVVAASVAATAHGLYAVALASAVPSRVALLYPVITDGLALVAYWATKQLRTSAYPWLVIVVAAGLSGLAQAVNLAGLGESPTWLRFGVGYWPAVAVLFAAHLLWLVGRGGAPAALGGTDRGTSEGESDPPAGNTSQTGEPEPDPLAHTNGNGGGQSKLARAVATRAAFEAEHGRRPSRPELASLAGVSESTARDALATAKN